MGLFRIALACTLIAFASAAAIADDSDLPHWKPGKKTIAKLDFVFHNADLWHGTPPDIEKYNRYYAGIAIKGRYMVRAEFAQLFDPVECNDGPPVRVCMAKVREGGIHIVPEDSSPRHWAAAAHTWPCSTISTPSR